uniref:Secreted protein n=1 Tax=Seriola dumerili TaxID=41447 RepID=A0A3B4UC09_SERDU
MCVFVLLQGCCMLLCKCMCRLCFSEWVYVSVCGGRCYSQGYLGSSVMRPCDASGLKTHTHTRTCARTHTWRNTERFSCTC